MSDTVYLSLISGGSALAGLIIGGIIALGGIGKGSSRNRPHLSKQSLYSFLGRWIIERNILETLHKNSMTNDVGLKRKNLLNLVNVILAHLPLIDGEPDGKLALVADGCAALRDLLRAENETTSEFPS